MYKPLVFAAFGRLHSECSLILESLARCAARRRGLRDHRLILSQTHASIAVILVRRAVHMVRHRLPSVHEEDVDLMIGPSATIVDAYNDLGTCRRVIAIADGLAEVADGLADAL